MNIDFTNKKNDRAAQCCRHLSRCDDCGRRYFVDAAWQSDTGRRFLRKDRGRNQKVGD